MRTPLFVIPLGLAVAATAASEEKQHDARAGMQISIFLTFFEAWVSDCRFSVFGFPVSATSEATESDLTGE